MQHPPAWVLRFRKLIGVNSMEKMILDGRTMPWIIENENCISRHSHVKLPRVTARDFHGIRSFLDSADGRLPREPQEDEIAHHLVVIPMLIAMVWHNIESWPESLRHVARVGYEKCFLKEERNMHRDAVARFLSTENSNRSLFMEMRLALTSELSIDVSSSDILAMIATDSASHDYVSSGRNPRDDEKTTIFQGAMSTRHKSSGRRSEAKAKPFSVFSFWSFP